MSSTVGIVVFPGSNCENDVVEAVENLGGTPRIVWHGDTDLSGLDSVVLPGGFAHGDYLRPGAIARFSPVMEAVSDYARSGGPVVGICNGFQVLTESRLLPGALQKNSGLRFLCRPTPVRVENKGSVLTAQAEVGAELMLPINHFDGSYLADRRTRDMLRDQEMVVLRYLDNPNGSVDDIAGICNQSRNVVGLMPHPERATDPLTGGTDGAVLIASLLAAGGGADTLTA